MSSNDVVFWAVYTALVAGLTYVSSDQSVTLSLWAGIGALLCASSPQEVACGIAGLGIAAVPMVATRWLMSKL